MYDYLVVGSGLYGATFAHRLKHTVNQSLLSTRGRTLLAISIQKG